VLPRGGLQAADLPGTERSLGLAAPSNRGFDEIAPNTQCDLSSGGNGIRVV